MTTHSFVDESKDPYLLVAAFIRPAHLAKTRQAVNSLILPRQRRIHFCKERDSRRSHIMSRLIELPIEAVVYQADNAADEKTARRACLTALVRECVARDVRRLVIERDDSLIEFDRRLIREQVGTASRDTLLVYEHVQAYHEALLAIPDAVAWCWTKGSHWRVKAKHLITAVHRV